MTTICGCLIVKNEAHVIRRCLESVKPFIDAWCICDTGSTDGTQDIIREFMNGMPGELHERGWLNFGHNRSEALALAREEGCDYTFVIDADEVLDFGPGPVKPVLTADSYMLTTRYGGSRYLRKHIVRSTQAWYYEGPVHEYVTCATPGLTEGALEWPQVVVNHDGARSRDPMTYINDALLLIAALKRDPGNARNQFYLAQSYFDAGRPEMAIPAYEKRIALGGWSEEVFISKYKIGRAYEITGKWPAALDAYLDAWNLHPHRAEPLFHVANHYHHQGMRTLACQFYRIGATIPLPGPENLFVEASIHDFLLPLERAVACYWAGLHEEAVSVADALLASGRLPEQYRALVEDNREISLKAMGRT